MGTKPRRVLKPDAVPTRQLPTKMSPVKSPSRAMRAEKRKSRAMIEDLTTVREDDMPLSSKQLRFSEPEGSYCLNCETLRQEVGDLKNNSSHWKRRTVDRRGCLMLAFSFGETFLRTVVSHLKRMQLWLAAFLGFLALDRFNV